MLLCYTVLKEERGPEDIVSADNVEFLDHRSREEVEGRAVLEKCWTHAVAFYRFEADKSRGRCWTMLFLGYEDLN